MVQPASRAQVDIGDTTVTYLPDGHGWVDPFAFFPSSAPDGWAAHAEFLNSDGRFPVSIGSFLIRTGERVLLVDLGLGPVEYAIPGAVAFRGGELVASLEAEGLAPSDVDTVVFTHLHHDHVGWVSDVSPAPAFPDGGVVTGLTFTGARHLVHEDEWRHWIARPGFPGPDATAVQAPLADRIEFAGDGDEVAPGVRVMATPGHTPGHLSLVVTDPAGHDERRLIVLGDVMHCQVQVVESHWTFRFDVDPDQGLATRERLLKELQRPHTLLAGGHFAGQVFGQVLPPEPRRAWAVLPGVR
ncbi:MBL fold metallo-hydrolase [Nonomuraea dietziae]|uniref:MBL fold metallo-hydrolase n=1 Tax=Nonomuraea dietziae TaxID=65515 RepID=UPI00340C96ED